MMSTRSRSEMYRSVATSSQFACGVWLERSATKTQRCAQAGACLEEPRRPHQRAPHVRRWRVVEAEALFRLLEIAADDVDEIVEIDLGIGIERVDVVHADQARGHVIFVAAGTLVFLHDVGLGLVVGAEIFDVHIRVFVADRLVAEEAQRLMHAHRPAHLLAHIGLDQLRAPIAVVTADEGGDADVVKEARQHHLLLVAGLERQRRALQQMVHRHEPVLEEVDERGLVRHLRQPRIGAHEEILARIARLQLGAADVIETAVAHVEQRRFGGDLVVELVHHFFFELVRLLRQSQRLRCGMRSHSTAPGEGSSLAANCPTSFSPVYTQFDSGETLPGGIARVWPQTRIPSMTAARRSCPISKSATSPSSTTRPPERSRASRASASTSRPRNSFASSVPRAAVSRRCSTSSPAFSSPPRARSASAAKRSAATAPAAAWSFRTLPSCSRGAPHWET